MGKKLVGGLLAVGFLFSFATAFQQQGFSSYEETAEGVTFSCTQQCVVLFDAPKKYDQLTLKGLVQGEGILAYGFLVGNNFFPLGQQAAQPLDMTINLRESPIFAQVPDQQPLLGIVVQGTVTAQQLQIRAAQLSSTQKLTQAVRDFFTNEPLRPYSINLRYGVTLLGKPLVKLVYRLFLIGAVLILFTKRSARDKKQTIFFLAVALVLLMGTRNLFNWIDRTTTGVKTYALPPTNQKQFFDLGDYISFTQKIREALRLDEKIGTPTSCQIYIDTPQDRPFGVHRELVYLAPCTRTQDKSIADYTIVYRKAVDPEDQNKDVLVEFNGSFLLAH